MIPGMKFEIKNLGPVKSAELELGDLTIIAGRNNTGKTYIAHSIYGYLKWFNSQAFEHRIIKNGISAIERRGGIPEGQVGRKLVSEGKLTWNMNDEDRANDRLELWESVSQEFSRVGLDSVFRHPILLLDSPLVRLKLSPDELTNQFGNFTYGRIGSLGNVNVTGSRTAKTFSLSWEAEKSIDTDNVEFYDLLTQMAGNTYAHAVLSGLTMIDSPVIFTSARSFITYFFDALSLANAHIAQELARSRHQSSVSETLQFTRASLYSRPVQDNLNFFVDSLGLGPSFVSEDGSALLEELEEIMGGRIEAEDRDSLRFVVDGLNQSTEVPPHLFSDSIKDLANLYQFIKYHFEESRNQFLIIDEPESHLDTANQVWFARFLARLVNNGMKILITTHSDYIIKEFNNLIMLNSSFEDKDAIMKEFDYQDGESLDPGRVRTYITEEGRLTHCPPDDYGMAMHVFDDTIDNINRAAMKMASRISLKDGRN